MNPEHYTLVFSVADSGYKSWKFPAFGLIFIFVGIFGIPIFNRFSRRPWSPGTLVIFQMFYAGFAVLWTVISFVTTFGDYWAAQAALKDGTAQYVGGTVEHFVPMPITGHSMESFDVGGVPFRYSDNVITAGFNHTTSHGGPIQEGLPVHIWYRGQGRSGDNEILKLEIVEK